MSLFDELCLLLERIGFDQSARATVNHFCLINEYNELKVFGESI